MPNSFTLISKRRDEDILYTTVDFTIDGVLVPNVQIAHYRPATKQEVRQNIIKRGMAEKERLTAIQTIDSFINNLDTNG